MKKNNSEQAVFSLLLMWWFSMQKTADGLKKGVQKSVFSNVSWIRRVLLPTSCFFKNKKKCSCGYQTTSNVTKIAILHVLTIGLYLKNSEKQERAYMLVERTTTTLGQLMFLKNQRSSPQHQVVLSSYFWSVLSVRMNPFERAKPAPKRKGNWIQLH